MATVRELQRRERRQVRSAAVSVGISAVISGAAVVGILVSEAVSPGFVAWYYGVPVVVGTAIWWMVLSAGETSTQAGGHLLLVIQPVMVVCGVVAALLHLPERAAWLVSESRMTAAAQQCERMARPQWVGVFLVEEMARNRNGACHFRVGDRMGRDGLAYFPPSVEPVAEPANSTHYTPFDGRWYRYDFVADYTMD
ncbi:hypothetical protein [Nocardia sp. NPDC058666]|uniref:hypothetical protein n=1 Tax=Nocardia sp. NPDC058666 TaxID=3346587 RepID=UPI0036553EDD